MKKLFILSTCICFLLSTVSYAQNIEEKGQDGESIQLKGTHSISLHGGFQDFQSKLAYTSGGVTAASKFVGYVSYQYWRNNNSAFNFAIGILESETIVRFSSTYSKTTIPIVVGYNFYPDSFHWGSAGRGYFGMNVGTYIETFSGVSFDTNNFTAGTDTTIKPGGDLHFGMDFFPAKFLRVGPQLAFHATEHFQGIAVSLTMGIVL